MNSIAIDDVNHSNETDEDSQEHERRGRQHSWTKGLARPLLEPDHNGNQRYAEDQSSIGERHFDDILLHYQGFGVCVDRLGHHHYGPPKFRGYVPYLGEVMKVRNSLKSLIKRHRDNKLVRRKGRVYIINKTNPRFKARQG